MTVLALGGIVAGEGAAQLGGFLGGGDRVLVAADPAVADAEVAQRHGEAGEVGGAVAGEGAAQLNGFLGRGDRVLVAADPAVAAAEVGQRGGEAGEVGGVMRRGRGRAGRLPRPGRSRPGGGRPPVADAEIGQRASEAGEVSGVVGRARRSWTASSAGAIASWWRPTPP